MDSIKISDEGKVSLNLASEEVQKRLAEKAKSIAKNKEKLLGVGKMTKKLENASGNLKEILIAIADGKEVQFKNHKDSWRDYDTELIDNYMGLNLNFEWRIKPDAFKEAWDEFELEGYADELDIARFFWNARGEHKDNG